MLNPLTYVACLPLSKLLVISKAILNLVSVSCCGYPDDMAIELSDAIKPLPLIVFSTISKVKTGSPRFLTSI